MANYNCTVRTNYFHVKDPEKFRELMSRVYGSEDSIDLWEEKDSSGNLVFGFGVYGGISGLRSSLPVDIDADADEWTDEDADEEDSYDAFINALREHAADGDAILIMESGYEKMRYVTGFVTVITSTACESIDMTALAKNRARDLLNSPDWTTKCEY